VLRATDEYGKVLSSRDMPVTEGGVQVGRTMWWLGGFSAGDPIRFVRYANAVVVEKATPATQDRLLGSHGVSYPYHVFSMAKLGLAGVSHVRVSVFAGKLVVMALHKAPVVPGASLRAYNTARREEALDRVHAPAPQPATSVAPVAAVVNAHVDAPVEMSEPASVVGQYAVPGSGKRLQLQGRWLNEHGFMPGARYTTSVQGGKVHVTLATDGERTVTKHSEGRSKLYVPHEGLATLACGEVRVEARSGQLTLVAA
jgi:hypothetical protein